MKTNKLKLMSSALVVALGLCACTSNTGVATQESAQPSEQVLGSDPAEQTVDLSGKSVETVYGSQLPQYLNHQYYFEGEPVSMTESNFYFIDTFTELCNYAGYYYEATPDGFVDLSASFPAEAESEYQTVGDFFVSYSEEMLESACIICKLAADQGLTLPEDQLAQIDSLVAEIESGAATAGITTDEYLSIYYGEGVTLDSFRQTIVNYYMADYYTQDFINNYEFDPDEITVPNVRYTLFQVTADMTDEQKAEAEANANAVFDEADGDVDVYAVSGALAYTNGTAADYGDIAVPNDGSIDQVFTDWAWDESRQEGDIEVIYSENFGYFVVAYLGTTEVDQSVKDQIAVQSLSSMITDAIDNNTYEFYTNDAYEPAPTPASVTPELPEELGVSEIIPVEEGQDAHNASLTGHKGLDILLIGLSVVGGVAIIGLAAIGVMNITKKNGKKNAKKTTSEDKEASSGKED